MISKWNSFRDCVATVTLFSPLVVRCPSKWSQFRSAQKAVTDTFTNQSARISAWLVGAPTAVAAATADATLNAVQQLFHPNNRGVAVLACFQRAVYERVATDPCRALDHPHIRSFGTATATGAPTTVVAGAAIPFTINDWVPGQQVTATVYSDPVSLGVFNASNDGTITGNVVLPSTLNPGVHTIVFSGPVNDTTRTVEYLVSIPGIPRAGEATGVYLCCFSTDTAVAINYEGLDYAMVSPDATGGVYIEVPTPPFVSPGSVNVTATGTDSGTTASTVVAVRPLCAVCMLNPTGGNVLNGGSIRATNASIGFNSSTPIVANSRSVLTSTGPSASILSAATGVTNNGATITPAVTTRTTIRDPYAALPTPTPLVTASNGSFTVNGSNQNSPALAGGSWDSITVNGNSNTVTLNPGTYGSITLNGNNGRVVFNPGVYTITGALTLNGNNALQGSNILLYLACGTSTVPRGCNPGEAGGAITLNGQSAFGSLSGRDNTDPTYAGLLIFADRENTRTLTFNGNGPSGPSANGSIYARKAAIVLNGNTTLTLPLNSDLVAANVTVNANASITVTHN